MYLLNTHAHTHVSDFDTVTEPSVSATRFPASKGQKAKKVETMGTLGNASEIGSPYISGVLNKTSCNPIFADLDLYDERLVNNIRQ